MSGILAMLKRDCFQPSDPALFNTVLSSVSAALSRQARTAAAGSDFMRAKRRESLLAHTTLPVPESQKCSLTTSPGSSSGLFDSELLSEVVSQVHSSSQISSNLALSRSLRRGRSTPASSSSPLTGPRLPSFTRGKPYGKRSSSSSRTGGRKRFRGSKGGLLLPDLRVSGGGSHLLSGPFPAVVCPSIGRPGGTGAEPWVVEVLRVGYCLPFLSTPPLSNVPIPMPSYSPTSIKGAALEEVTLGLIAKGAVELAPLTSPGFYSRLCVVWKTRGHGVRSSTSPISITWWTCLPSRWRPFSLCSCRCVRGTGWPPSSQGSVSSSAGSSSFSSLSSLHVSGHCLPIQSAVLWPLHGSTGLHQGHGSCFSYTPFYGDPYETVSRRLASPVILSGVPPRGSSDCPPTLSRVGDCGQPPEIQPGSITGGSVSGGCHRLHLFQGFSVGGAHLTAAVNSRRVSVLRLAYRELMAIATRRPFFAGSPSSWRQTEDAVPPALPPSILGSSGSGGSSVCVDGVSSRPPVVAPSPSSVSRSVSLPGVSRPTLLVRRLRRGVGAHLDRQIASGMWDAQQSALSINARELLAVQLGLHQFQSSLQGRTVAVFCDNTTAVAYLHKEGGTRSPLLNTLAQEFLRWTESLSIRLAPQFLLGSNNVLADALSRPHQLPHSKWSLILTVFQSLRRLWPVQIDLFATSDNHRCSIYFSPFRDPMSAGTDAFLQSWAGLPAYAFTPVAIVPRVLAKLRSSMGTELTLVAPHWAQRPWFSDLLQLLLAPPVILPARQDLLHLPRSRHLYPDLRRLRLHAWRLSSDLLEPLDSPPQ